MQVYAKLEWRPFLIIFALRRFKVERIVLCACEVVAPKVDAPLSEVKQHMGFECAVEVLTCGVFFVPINAAKAIALNADNDVFQQIVGMGVSADRVNISSKTDAAATDPMVMVFVR